MISTMTLFAASIAFLVAMYVCSIWGERFVYRRGRLHQHRLVYPLALGVFFSAWAFFGAGGAAGAFGGTMVPILSGALCSLIVWPLLAGRMAILSKRYRLISLAHFLSYRHGNDRVIAIVITVLGGILVATYGALQFSALDAAAGALLAGADGGSARIAGYKPWILPSIVAVIAGFSLMMIGKARDVAVNHPGLMLVLAVKSIIKLAILVIVAVVMTIHLLPELQSADTIESITASFTNIEISPAGWFVSFLLGASAIILLPHQYQAAVVENVEWRDLWFTLPVLGFYLLAVLVISFGLGAIGVQSGLTAAGGMQLFVLQLPLIHGFDGLAMVAFVGGLAAASGLMVLGALTVSTMVTEDIVMPILGHDRGRYLDEDTRVQRLRLIIRRSVIVGLIAISAGIYELFVNNEYGGSWAIIPLIGAAMILPIFLGALYWPTANRTGVYAGLAGGIVTWIYTCWIPVLAQGGIIDPAIMQGPGAIEWLRPAALFGLEGEPVFVHGTFWTLLITTGLYIAANLVFNRSRSESVHANSIVRESNILIKWLERHFSGLNSETVTVGRLLALAGRYIGTQEAEEQFERYSRQMGSRLDESHFALEGHFFFTERLLADVLGSTGARVVMSSDFGETGIDNVAEMFSQAGEAMEASRAVIRATLESMDHGIAVMDANYLVVGWNRKQEELLGPYRDVLRVGNHFSDVLRTFGQLSGSTIEETEERIAELREHFKAGVPISYERELLDGRCYEIRWSPLPEGAWSVITAEITNQKKIQQQLIDAKEAAELANRSKSEFLANMSHELRTPLNAIIGFSEIISEQLFGEVGNKRYVRYAENIQQSGHLLLQIIGDILDLSKVEIGNIQLKEEPVVLAELVETCVTIVRERARKAEVVIEVDIADDLPRIICDATRMKQVVLNLLSNGVKFNRPGGTVTLRAFQDGETVAIEVVDTGIGMSADDIDIAVTRFGRTDRVLKGAYEGTGLGLPLSIKLTELQGGKLDIESTPEVGTRIVIRFPKDRLASASAAA